MPKALLIRLPDELHRRVKAAAALRGITVQQMTIDLFEADLKKEVRR